MKIGSDGQNLGEEKTSAQFKQSKFDFPVVAILRLLQFFAILALLVFAAMGFWEVSRSAKEFYNSSIASSPSLPVVESDENLPNNSEVPGGAKAPQGAKASHKKHSGQQEGPIPAAFSGLEYLLMAPLFFLVLRSLDQYVDDLSEKQERREEIRCFEQTRKNISNCLVFAKDGEKQRWQEMLDKLNESRAKMEKIDKESGLGESLGREALLETKALSIGLLFTIVATHLVGKLISDEYDAGARSSLSEGSMIGLALVIILGGAFLTMEFAARRRANSEPGNS